MGAFAKRPGNYFAGIGIIAILFLLFLISLISLSPFLHLLGLSQINGTILFITRILYWLCLLLLWFYSTRIEKQDLLIWKEKEFKIRVYVISVVALYLVLLGGMVLVQMLLSLAHLAKKSDIMPVLVNILRENKVLLVFTALTAGVVEELIMRGYIQPRLQLIFKNPWASIIISSLAFGLLHYKYGTAINMAGPFFIGLIFSVYYWKFRNIKVLIACHFLWDLVALLILVNRP
jgi:membrane protease YdiL (CAAX protease family)